MKVARLLAAPLALALLPAGCRGTPPERGEPVLFVLEVGLAIEDSDPPALLITARGEADSAGWTEPALRPRAREEDAAEAADGIADFELVALPPQGLSATVVTRVEATYRWPGFDRRTVRGVRVHARHGKPVLAHLDE